jgi:hypothetical protein
MKVDVVVRDNSLAERLDIDLIPYKQAVQLAFRKIEQNLIISSWKDALISSSDQSSLQEYGQVPTQGCFIDRKAVPLQNNSAQQVWANIQAIGGERGWYYGNWLWKIRGYLDKLVGGIGLRRGRTHPTKIKEGDALDFWRVLIADDEERRLLLYAEMKLPGEAWLEFKIKVEKERPVLYQTATFRPYGIIGRLYWYAIVPLHYFVFNGMVRKLEAYSPSN